MKNLAILTAVLFVVIVIIIKYINYSHMAGFWKASGDFCQQSGLNLFIIYIAPFNLYSNKTRGYVIMQNNDGFIINTAAEFTLNLMPSLGSHNSGKLNIKWLDGNEYDFLPSSLNIEYFCYVGKYILKNGDTVYGELYKDSNMSDLTLDNANNKKEDTDKEDRKEENNGREYSNLENTEESGSESIV